MKHLQTDLPVYDDIIERDILSDYVEMWKADLENTQIYTKNFKLEHICMN